MGNGGKLIEVYGGLLSSFDRKSGKVIGYLSDLTVKGAMVIGEHHLEQGDNYQLRIDLPESKNLKRTIWISMQNQCGPDRN